MKKIKSILVALALISITFLNSSAYARSYNFNIIDLGTVGNDTASYARSINNSGVVVGDSVSSNGQTQGFVWSKWWPNNGQMLGLKNSSSATAIDSSGVILGHGNNNKGALWRSYNPNSNGQKINHNATMAYNINDNGQVLASHGDPSQTMIYSIWGGHNPVKAGGNMEIKYASDVNTSGHVIGETSLGTPYIWDMYNDSTELISSISGSAADINRSNEVVGTKNADVTENGTVLNAGQKQAYIYKNGEVLELGYVGVGASSEAYAINEDGIVVGTSNGNAFVWSADSGMLNLNDLLPDGSEWSNLSVASDINDLGQIVGWGTINGETHSFIISDIVAAPEPKLIFILGLVVSVILLRIFKGSTSLI